MFNDVKADIRVVSSDDTVLEVTPEVLHAIMLMHPSEAEDSMTPIIQVENIAVTADDKKIIRSLRSLEHIGRLVRMSVSGYRGRLFERGISLLCPRVRHFIRIASVDSAVK